MLEYDNSAFYYFAVTLLTIYILPASFSLLSEVLCIVLGWDDEEDENKVKVNEQQKEEEANKSKGKANKKGKDKKLTGKAKDAADKEEKENELIEQEYKQAMENAKRLDGKPKGWEKINFKNVLFLALVWALYIFLISLLMGNSRVGASSFDPYQILSVAHTATEGEIKKAYRKLSLRFHPDKNVGDAVAAEMFVKISKAYETLTNPRAKENFEKFGNPDGKASYEVSIGLPKFLIENPKAVLLFYLLGMIILVPAIVMYCYSENKKLAEKEKKQQEAIFAKLPASIKQKMRQQQIQFDSNE